MGRGINMTVKVRRASLVDSSVEYLDYVGGFIRLYKG